MNSVIRLTGLTREDRFSVTARLGEALSSAGGWILDHHQFSNLALCISFEIQRKYVSRLHSALAATGLNLSPESKEALASLTSSLDVRDENLTGTLQAMFIHDEPEVRVPGPLG